MELLERLNNQLTAKFGSAILSSQMDYDFPVFVVEKSQIIEVLGFLKNDESTGFHFLSTLCAINFTDNTGAEF